MTTKQIIAKYGTPNITGDGYLTSISLPYPMRIAWQTESTIKKFSCHRMVATNFSSTFNDLLSHYGY
ncbi:MAG: hypothetical protein ACK53L_33305, partial [Pirellulaceae bacterium]